MSSARSTLLTLAAIVSYSRMLPSARKSPPAIPLIRSTKRPVGFGHVQLGSDGAVTLTLPFTIGSTPLGSVQVFDVRRTGS